MTDKTYCTYINSQFIYIPLEILMNVDGNEFSADNKQLVVFLKTN